MGPGTPQLWIGDWSGEVVDHGPDGHVSVRIRHASFPLRPVATIEARSWTHALGEMRDWVGDWEKLVALDTGSDGYIMEVLEVLRHKYPPPLPRLSVGVKPRGDGTG